MTVTMTQTALVIRLLLFAERSIVLTVHPIIERGNDSYHRTGNDKPELVGTTY